MAKAGKTGTSDVDIREFLNSQGFDKREALTEARGLLEAEGLTHSKKKRMATTKLDRAGLVLQHLTRVCRDEVCQTMTQDAQRRVPVSAKSCSVCGGSENRRWCRYLSKVLPESGVARLVVVGGSPEYRKEMMKHVDKRLKCRFVDGTGKPRREVAKANKAWADLCVVWGPSQLKHKVSDQYKDAQHKVMVTERSIKSLCRTVIEYVTAPRVTR